jgi:hypothetical protein
LRLQAANRSIKRIEDTHNVLSKIDLDGQPVMPGMAVIERRRRKGYAKTKNALDQMLKQKCPGPGTGAQLPGGQQLPGESVADQLAVGAAG